MTKDQKTRARALARELARCKAAGAIIADCAEYLEEYAGMESVSSLVAEWSDTAPAVLFAVFDYDVVIRAFATCALHALDR